MPVFASYDGVELGYHLRGQGVPVVCLPGGPGRASEYLGGLGGLERERQLVLLDPRGVGASADPGDPATFRVDRLVRDVEALRDHLGLSRMDLLAHSAGAVLAMMYAAAHPAAVSHLVLVTPGLAAIGVHVTQEQIDEVFRRSAAESWYADAVAAWTGITEGDLSVATFLASRPLFYGRWDAAAQAHAVLGITERHLRARQGYFADVALDVPAIRAGLGDLDCPVLLYGGELDPLVRPGMLELAASVFRHPSVAVQPSAGHFPWVDDPQAFADVIGGFLGSAPAASQADLP